MARGRLGRRSESKSSDHTSYLRKKCKEYSKHFPVRSILDVLTILQSELHSNHEPNLAFWSAFLGLLEGAVTQPRSASADGTFVSGMLDEDDMTRQSTVLAAALRLPVIEYADVEAVYSKFESIVKAEMPSNVKSLESSTAEYPPADYVIVTGITDCIWRGLGGLGSYEKAHLQFLTSYILSYQLDSFGCALAVVAAGQLLNYADMHLVLSEGHAWLAYGPDDSASRVEVSWHGKNPDTRKSITVADMKERWLYSGGKPLVCSRYTELALLFSAINPWQSSTADSMTLTFMQYCLLEALYTAGKLDGCPQAHVALAEAAERLTLTPSSADSASLATGSLPSLPSSFFVNCEHVYAEAVKCSQKHCADAFVYPYIALAAFYFRQARHQAALRSWTAASRVLSRYTYTAGDDEELYKDLHEVVGEKIPHILTTEPSAPRNPAIFSYIICIIDGLCKWEEGSNCAVLHAGWAKNIAVIVSKFEFEVRRQVRIEPSAEDESGEPVMADQSEPPSAISGFAADASPTSLCVQFASKKMGGLRALLVAEKINTEAVQLQMAALVGAAGRKLPTKRSTVASPIAEDVRCPPPLPAARRSSVDRDAQTMSAKRLTADAAISGRKLLSSKRHRVDACEAAAADD